MLKTPSLICAALVTVGWLALPTSASAQVKPHTSGHPSYHAPVMRTDGSGFKYPNKSLHPRYHHSYQHPPYRMFPFH